MPSNTDFVRLLAALAVAGAGGLPAARAAAATRWGEPSVVTRAFDSALTTGSLHGVDFRVLMAGFLQAAQSESVIERLGLLMPVRRVGFNIPVAREVRPAAVEWTAQGGKKLVGSMSLEPLKLDVKKIAGAVALTVEALRQAGPDIERAIAASLTSAYAALEAQSLLSDFPGDEGRPAGLLHGVTPVHATGDTAADFAADVKSALAGFQGDLSRAVWVTSSADAIAMATLDVTFTANVSATGGVLAGVPLIATPAAPQGQLILLDTGALILAADVPTLDTTTEATIDSVDADGVVSTLLLWQMNLLAVLIERAVNWTFARENSVAVITGLFARAATR